MKSMNELLAEISAQETIVTHVEVQQTDQGEILVVHLQPMQHPDVLWMSVTLPTEVVDQYDFQEAGAKWKAGWKNVSDHLKKK